MGRTSSLESEGLVESRKRGVYVTALTQGLRATATPAEGGGPS
jgi:hypothetical protein